jgi:hypothetical protein
LKKDLYEAALVKALLSLKNAKVIRGGGGLKNIRKIKNGET